MNTTTDANKKFQKELNSGTAALVLLSILARADEPMYGYRIAKFMEVDDEDVPMMKQGGKQRASGEPSRSFRLRAAPALLQDHTIRSRDVKKLGTDLGPDQSFCGRDPQGENRCLKMSLNI